MFFSQRKARQIDSKANALKDCTDLLNETRLQKMREKRDAENRERQHLSQLQVLASELN